MTINLRYFKPSEWDCPETGENRMKESHMRRMDELRHRVGFPLVVISGYRSPRHSLERDKVGGPGFHSEGVATDVACRGPHMRKLVLEALKMGFTGIGVNKGSVHLDDGKRVIDTMWGY